MIWVVAWFFCDTWALGFSYFLSCCLCSNSVSGY